MNFKPILAKLHKERANPDGARAMKAYLKDAQLAPFGTFDIEVI
jgi:hypothetical protein